MERKKFNYNGREYDIYELAELSGLKVGTLRHRLYALRLPLEQAMMPKIPEKRYTFKGESLTAAQWAERIGISVSCFRARLRRCNYNAELVLRPKSQSTVKMQPCNMDCFNCKFSDCINNNRPTSEETQMLKHAEVHLA
jgi:hypothetical protein